MKIVKKLKSVLAVSALCASLSAGATTAIVYGSEVVSSKTGSPLLGKGETVRLYVETGTKNGKKALVKAVEKCRADWPDIPKNFPLSEFDGHCVVGGVSELKGHTVVAIGGPGDNSFIWSHAMGDKTRDIAMSHITKSRILEKSKGAKIVWDKWDEDGI